MTFRELYLLEKNKPTPAMVFLEDIADLTKRSVNTVRMWAQDQQQPDALAQSLIEKKFGIKASVLFPKK